MKLRLCCHRKIVNKLKHLSLIHIINPVVPTPFRPFILSIPKKKPQLYENSNVPSVLTLESKEKGNPRTMKINQLTIKSKSYSNYFNLIL